MIIVQTKAATAMQNNYKGLIELAADETNQYSNKSSMPDPPKNRKWLTQNK